MTNPLFDSTNVETNIDPTKDYSTELMGEGKKYKDVPALARAIMEKDAFIERLKSETAQLRSSVQGETKIDELLNTLRAQSTTPANSGTPATTPETKSANQPQTGLSAEDVERLLAAREREKTETSNVALVTTQLRKAWGANHGEVLRQKTEELGATPEFMTNLAKANPSAFLKLVAAESVPESTPGRPTSSVNTTPAQGKTAVGGHTKSYYDNLRKQVGDAKFFHPTIQNELHRNMMTLGEAFFDN